MKYTRSFVRSFLASVFLLAISAVSLRAQGVTVSGRVTSDNGQPLTGVSVFVQGMGIGSTTDEQGRYTFAVPSGRALGQAATLTARRIGYTARTVQVTLTAATSVTQDFVLTANPL